MLEDLRGSVPVLCRFGSTVGEVLRHTGLIPGQKGACHSSLHFNFAFGGQQWNWERHRGRLIKPSWRGASSQHTSCIPDSQGGAGAGTWHLLPHPFSPPHHLCQVPGARGVPGMEQGLIDDFCAGSSQPHSEEQPGQTHQDRPASTSSSSRQPMCSTRANGSEG